MDDYLDYRRYAVTSPDRTRTLFLDALNVFLSFLRTAKKCPDREHGRRARTLVLDSPRAQIRQGGSDLGALVPSLCSRGVAEGGLALAYGPYFVPVIGG